MDSVAVTVPLRQPTKKMKKRKELDALAPPHAVSRRTSGKRSSQELLTDSSDERSEYWNTSTRSSRKCRGRRSQTCPGFLKACSAFLACASVLATASLIWLFIDVRQQLTALRTELDQVIAGNEGVPDALQKCHSMSRDLQNNQTVIFSHLSDLRFQISNVTIQLVNIQHGLHQVQEWVHAAPELANVPKDLKALSTTVVSLGSQIRDLDSTVTTLKETNTRLQNVQTTALQNISSVQHALSELINITQKPQILTTNETKLKTEELNAAILRVTNNLTHVNETLSRTLQWTSEDQKKDHKILNSLLDTTQNVSTKVISLEGEYAKMSEQITTLSSLTEQVERIYAANVELNDRLKRLEQSYISVKNSTTAMLNTITKMKNDKRIVDDQDTTEMPVEGSQNVQRIGTNT
ncbi:uncharacterized protein LOC124955898 isoform X2 [Vespa velutina]|uniref:uncharacterized protein LOC124955898 isoform X2 n=1 Tax=Vespa velutina TaxID=202808 RepID=UPI001FB506B5|nr:uncharacterized protein LOC124955898 isoform X2 [Vespa velutina]XP_047366971.1 uncharacterized protein LOC124955898 isoform X2 [Vespa velutina]XP_047366972.1 uncharacterized protein LOC124955898 isoform X2 [Vespa velutina]XP_047366973.1 uncharacterized protein LOC124955898 isoform X2 [Vespa velutina]XP_047366974.1 uncharacterized protein LOC124955898 isoform X2 [Vespa velutina]